MASKSECDNTSSSTNDQSDDETQGSLGSNTQEEEEEIGSTPTSNVTSILKRLQTTGAVVHQPKRHYRCYTCKTDFRTWSDFETHLLRHVSMPIVLIEKLMSDYEDSAQSGNENWSEDEDILPQQTTKTTPQKIDISQILNKTGISVKKSTESDISNTALNKLSGLGLTFKKNVIVKKETDAEDEEKHDVLKKLGQLGGIKLKLKSEGNNSNSFKVVNGLKDFKTSDDEDEISGNEECPDDKNDDEEIEKSGELEGLSDSDNESTTPINTNNDSLQNLKNLIVKSEPTKNNTSLNSDVSEAATSKLPGRPTVKQTPKRGTNLPTTVKQFSQQAQETTTPPSSSLTRRQSHDMSANGNNVVVKQEVDVGETLASNVPLFNSQIKSERSSPSPSPYDPDNTPALATVKSEPGAPTPSMEPPAPTATVPLLPIAKKEDTVFTVIEINGDSNDEDDDCCVVSATPAQDIKPVIAKIETVSTPYPAPSYPPSSSPSCYSPTIRAPSTPSTEKQHNFNWNAPDSKPPLDMLEKSADDIFESLLSSSTKKDNMSISDASEYISLDTLGPQHTCDVCNTRFTDVTLLEEHKRITGHSKSLITPTSSQILQFRPTTNILHSLLPVKALAEQVGKLSTISSSGTGFTHQQNVMINIQAYPGAGGVIVPPQPYNAYTPVSGQNMHAGYPANQNTMYATPEQSMPHGQYPGQHYVGQQGYNQFQPPMSKSSGYPMVQNTFPTVSAPYSPASPLQSMQQAYGVNSNMMNTQPTIGQMGPPGSSPSQYVPTSSPSGAMKQPGACPPVKVHNVQSFTTGHAAGQTVAPGSDVANQIIGGQITPSNQIRIAPGASVIGTRRLPAPLRNIRPTVRPGIQVQGHVRLPKTVQRMPLKRPGAPVVGPGQKRRTDMLLPGKHDNEDCQVMSMQKQRDGLPLIQSVQGAKDKFNLGSQISITKKTVNKEANAMASVLASRGISVKQKQKSRSPTPERPVPHIPNLGAGVSIKHTSKSSNFTIPEAKVGGGMTACKICKKMFMNLNSLEVHMTAAHPNHKIPIFKCEECPASYPKYIQLQHHKRVFHNVTGANRELGLPVVDLSQEDNIKRLNNLGIHSFIPLANREQANGCFGIPVLSVANMQNGITSGLSALGADGLLSLGPLKSVLNS